MELETLGAVALTDTATHYVLLLYVVATTPRSMRAVSNIRKICEEHLPGRYELEVVDISQHPLMAKGEQIIAAPTLIRKLPLPLRRFIGDMSQTKRILLGLDLHQVAEDLSLARDT